MSESNDAFLTFSEAAKAVPRRKVTPGTIWRWARRGVKVRGGSLIQLRHIRVGGRVYTTRDWMLAFFEELANLDRNYFRLLQHGNRLNHEMPLISHREAEAALQEAGL